MTVVTVSSGAVTDVDTAGLDALDTSAFDVDAVGLDALDAGAFDVDAAGTGARDGAARDSAPLGGVVPVDTRHARALAALRSAEVRTGVRKQAMAASRDKPRESFRDASRDTYRESPPPESFRDTSRESCDVSRESSRDTSRELSRVRVRALPGGLADVPVNGPAHGPAAAVRSAPSSGSRTGGPDEGARVLPVHPRLAGLLPDGGLRTGTTVVVRGSTSLLLTLLAEASRDGAWTVLVGYPAAGMAAAADAGCDLARTLVVPLPAGSGVDASAVLAALIDGMDVVVVGPEVALLDQDRRRLTARARERGTVLLAALPTPALSAGFSPLHRPSAGRRASTQPGWGGAQVVLEATEGAWAGVDQGAGWLRQRTLWVRRTGRGSAARPLHLEVELPVYRPTGPGAEGAGEERAGENPEVREVAAPDGDVQRRGSEDRPRLGLVG